MREDFVFNPAKAALLVVDMQKHFCNAQGAMYVPGVEDVINNIEKILGAFSSQERPVIFTRHIDSLDTANLMLRWWQTKFTLDDPMTEIIDRFDTGHGQVITKPQYDAFLNTNLETILRDLGIKQVVVTGVLTNCCCESTARDAFMRGFEVYFVKDATATYDTKMHDASLLNLSYAFATVLKTRDILASFE